MAKPIIPNKQKVKSPSSSLVARKKSWGIFIIGIILIFSLVFFFTFFNAGKGARAGQAVYVTQEGTSQTIAAGQSASVRVMERIVAQITAVSGDTFNVDLYVDPNGRQVGSVAFKLEYNTAKFFLAGRSAQSALNVMSSVGADGIHQFWNSEAKISALTYLARYQFRSTTDAEDIDLTNLQIRFFDLNMYETAATAYGPFDISVTVIPVPACEDTDEDDYGESGTDIRGCDGSNIIPDCDDNDPVRSPGFPVELCDGKDNKCELANFNENDAVQSIASPTVPAAERQRGVCYGARQMCSGGIWRNEYEINIVAWDYNSVEQCDFLDHDCDGAANTQNGNLLDNCAIGGAAVSPNVGRVSAQTAGNVYIDYDDMNLVFPQNLTPSDRLLYNLLYAARINTDCGADGQAPCTATLSPGTEVSFCKNNVYYLTENDIITGNDIITKYDPMESSPEIVDAIQNCG